MTNFNEAVKLINARDNYGILIHAFPDGDAVGSGFALQHALTVLGKKARVICSHEIPKMYSYISNVEMQDFEPENYIAVDVADISLLGEGYEKYTGKVLLSVDHHGVNRLFAEHNIIDFTSSSASELVLELIDGLGVKTDRFIAECIYTGLSTDTGCFKYSNTTAKSHIVAARLLEVGIDMQYINRIMFDTKSKSRIKIERMALDNMEFHFKERVTIITITNEMRKKSKASEGDLEGITALARQIEGVILGITVREKNEGGFKISMRTHEPVNAAEICSNFGGGGHERAAGCSINGTLSEVKEKILAACEPYVTQENNEYEQY